MIAQKNKLGKPKTLPQKKRNKIGNLANNSSILASKNQWTEEPGELQSMGSKELDTTEPLSMHENTCLTCPKYNPWKPTSTAPENFKLLNGPFKVWQIDFIQYPPSHSYKCILVMVYMFPHWTAAFPFRQAMISSVVKVFWRKIIHIQEDRL